MRTRLALTAFAVLLAAGAMAGTEVPAAAVQVPQAAPSPTSGAVSPQAPDPHPQLGGAAPDGSVPGGVALRSRAVIVPKGAPALPANLTAQSWVLSDLDTGEVLAARDPHGRYQPASVLKLLTAITVLPNLPGNQLVTVSPEAAAAEGSAVGLLAGGKYTVDNLFQALLLVSGNDAALALAQANGGVAKTVADMNATTRRLGAYDTYVQTPSGLDGWQQLTSAYDLSLVLRAAVDMPRLVAYDELRSASYPPKKSSAGAVGVYQFDNQSNSFFDTVPGALLSKTGFTDAAQHTYAAAAKRNGRRLGVVFLRAQRAPLDQWQQAAALFNWGFALSPSVQPVGTLIAPSSPNPSAAAPLAQPAVSAAGQSSTADVAAPPLRTGPLDAPPLEPASATHALGRRSIGSSAARVSITVLCVLLAVVAALRTRLHLRRRRRRRARPPRPVARPPMRPSPPRR